nr:hypothetical protein CFP56_21171 [Quercus suber]
MTSPHTRPYTKGYQPPDQRNSAVPDRREILAVVVWCARRIEDRATRSYEVGVGVAACERDKIAPKDHNQNRSISSPQRTTPQKRLTPAPRHVTTHPKQEQRIQPNTPPGSKKGTTHRAPCLPPPQPPPTPRPRPPPRHPRLPPPLTTKRSSSRCTAAPSPRARRATRPSTDKSTCYQRATAPPRPRLSPRTLSARAWRARSWCANTRWSRSRKIRSRRRWEGKGDGKGRARGKARS